MSEKDTFYRPSGLHNTPRHTVVSEMYRDASEEINWEESGGVPDLDNAGNRVITLQNRQIVGVLFSVSAGGKGEIFPIYLGRNIIGSGTNCDICLREGTVVPSHALLLARKEYDDDGMEHINLSISDNNSSYGTGLNDERLSDGRNRCQNGDILTIGYNYRLLVSLFNSNGKLSISGNFEAMPEEKPEESDLSGLSEAVTPYPVDSKPETPSTGIPEENDDSAIEFYKPTKKPNHDHSNNNTIIL